MKKNRLMHLFPLIALLAISSCGSVNKEVLVRDAIADDFAAYLQSSQSPYASISKSVEYKDGHIRSDNINLFGVFAEKDIYLGSFALWTMEKLSGPWHFHLGAQFDLDYPDGTQQTAYISEDYLCGFIGVWKRGAREVLHITEAAKSGWLSPGMFSDCKELPEWASFDPVSSSREGICLDGLAEANWQSPELDEPI